MYGFLIYINTKSVDMVVNDTHDYKYVDSFTHGW